MTNMIIDTDKLLEGVKMLNDYLTAGVVEVNFTKQDGSARKMVCTRRLDMIPVENQPKPKLPTDIVEAHDPQLFKVWDLEAKGWRSFRYTTIQSMKIDEPGL